MQAGDKPPQTPMCGSTVLCRAPRVCMKHASFPPRAARVGSRSKHSKIELSKELASLNH